MDIFPEQDIAIALNIIFVQIVFLFSLVIILFIEKK